MNRLGDIAVRVEAASGYTVGNVDAILHEIHGLLETVLAGGGEGAVDLRGLPLSPDEYRHLRAALGSGELSARLDALGESTVEETAHPGVWWITHRGAEGQVLAELVQVSFCPRILASDPVDVAAAAARLAATLAATEQHSGKDQER